jgi:hypothetical protein
MNGASNLVVAGILPLIAPGARAEHISNLVATSTTVDFLGEDYNAQKLKRRPNGCARHHRRRYLRRSDERVFKPKRCGPAGLDQRQLARGGDERAAVLPFGPSTEVSALSGKESMDVPSLKAKATL